MPYSAGSGIGLVLEAAPSESEPRLKGWMTKMQDILEKAGQVRLVIFDVDGVLTDGSLFLGDDGQEYKAFHSRDGHGMKMLQATGVAIGIITGRTSRVVELRMASLGVEHVFQGQLDKLPAYEQLKEKLANRRKRAYDIFSADGCWTGYNTMRFNNSILPDSYPFFDNRIGPHTYRAVKFCLRINNCCRMNIHFLSQKYENEGKCLYECSHKFSLSNNFVVNLCRACHFPDFSFMFYNHHFKN